MVENRCDMNIVPVEVKAETNTRAKSLINYCRKYTPPVAVRCSMNDYCVSQLPTSDETANLPAGPSSLRRFPDAPAA